MCSSSIIIDVITKTNYFIDTLLSMYISITFSESSQYLIDKFIVDIDNNELVTYLINHANKSINLLKLPNN